MLTPRYPSRTPARDRTSGFSLIEVLVALVLLSFGLLGLAGLQTTSLKNNESALIRSRAIAMGYDILDKIRANRVAAANGQYKTEFDTAVEGSTVAANDLRAWKRELKTLPGGQGSVTVNASSGTYIVSVRWQESKALDQADATGVDYQTITLRTQP